MILTATVTRLLRSSQNATLYNAPATAADRFANARAALILIMQISFPVIIQVSMGPPLLIWWRFSHFVLG